MEVSNKTTCLGVNVILLHSICVWMWVSKNILNLTLLLITSRQNFPALSKTLAAH